MLGNGANESFTIILVPDRNAEVRRFHVRKRLLLQAGGALFVWLAVGSLSAVFFLSEEWRRHEIRNSRASEVAHELETAQALLRESLAKTDEVVTSMVETSRTREAELESLKLRYDSLKILTEGKEDIARAHRAILMDRTPLDRFMDVFLGLFAGVFTSLVASWIWSRVEARGRRNELAAQRRVEEVSLHRKDVAIPAASRTDVSKKKDR